MKLSQIRSRFLRCALLSLYVSAAWSAVASAQVTVDGSRVGDGYGAAVSVQAVQTQFGDNLSEWDAAYAQVDAGRLCLMLTGNIEANFNKLEIMIDSIAGGQNVFMSVAGNDNTDRMNGLTFDAGFEADYFIIARRGFRFDLNFMDLAAQTWSEYLDVLGPGVIEGSGSTGTGVNASPIDVGYDNSNVAGVFGGCAAADQVAAQAVDTGLEICIDLADLGNPTGSVKVLVFQNGGGHDFASNQFLGPLTPPQCNLGGDGLGNFTGVVNFNLNDFAGDQFFVINLPACGNGVLDSGEDCDDGNTADGDGCDANCVSEICGNGVLQAGEQCDDGNTAGGDGCDGNCVNEVCGNGTVQSGEQCDDGNTAGGDGCDGNCVSEICGNGVLQAGEQCDDNNNANGDGCDANCVLEVCGNGVLQSGEQCDDGNNAGGDGCDGNCVSEICGNGVLQAGEQCDDGNIADGDGCSANCTVETVEPPVVPTVGQWGMLLLSALLLIGLAVRWRRHATA